MRVDGSIPPLPSESSIRLVSFNINGYRTLNHYHPWNELSSLPDIFNYLKADIVTLQELKLQRQDVTRSLVTDKGFHYFISLPKKKRGYSGVGVFVKSTREDLKILKAEEGITGFLEVSTDSTLNYRKIWERDGPSGLAIGGYTDNLADWKEGYKLDSDGRCVIVELNKNLVVISVYCLANSMGEEGEEERRCLFLDVLFKRAENLQKLGKRVIIMGDVNVAPSLIDRDDSMNEGFKDKTISRPKDPNMWFERANEKMTLQFRTETLPRRILNDYLYDFNEFDSVRNSTKILYDLGRLKNPNRLKMYTCWNTLKNNRPMNIGSRIDLFLATKEIKEIVLSCDIWSFLYGSDHCPIFCDLDMGKLSNSESQLKANYKHFEAVKYYGLGITKNIGSFFKLKSQPKTKVEPEKKEEKENLMIANPPEKNKHSLADALYTSRKRQKGQSTLTALVSKKDAARPLSESSLFVADSDDDDNGKSEDSRGGAKSDERKTPPMDPKSKITADTFKQILEMKSFNAVPQCKHNEPCVLRVTKKGPNAGRKFWCCSRPSQSDTWSHGDETDSNTDPGDKQAFSCSFFKWASKR